MSTSARNYSRQSCLVVTALILALALGACSAPDRTNSASSTTAQGGTARAEPSVGDVVRKDLEKCIAESKAQQSEGLKLNEKWTHIESESDFVAQATQTELPAKVKDGTGAEVEVTNISKIISAGDGVSATLGTLGLADKVFAASEDSTAPEGICAAEHFKFTKETGAEGLLSLEGTLFIGDNTKRHGDVAQKFRDSAMDAVVMDDQQSQVDKIKAVAEYVGAKSAGEKIAADLEKQLSEAKRAVEAAKLEKKKVIQITATGAGGKNAVAGAGTPGVELITSMGLTSVGKESGFRGFSREFSNEGLLVADPEIIIVAESDVKKWGGEDGMWKAFPTLKDTKAGQANRVIVMPDAQVRYTSPELGTGAIALAEALVKEFSGK